VDLIERDPPDVLELVCDFGGELQGKTRLPSARRPDERQQAVVLQQRRGVGQLLPAADERSRLHRQVGPVERLQRREVVGPELEEPLRLEKVLEPVLTQV
jgi:hypothetical protein